VVGTIMADRILSFDDDTGILRAEAGLSLLDMKRVLLPRGWFTPVTPGTQYVTLGGAVASDVHGKNHHVAGTIGRHVRSLRMRIASGEVLECSRTEHADLFLATLGGQGLTGHVLEVELAMEHTPTPWIQQESERVPNIDAFMDALQSSASEWPFTVGWIDCLSRGKNLGRGILIKGRWATPDQAPSAFPQPKRRVMVPFVFPGWALNDLSVLAFNQLYFHKHFQQQRVAVEHPEPFFYPLDAILQWNRIYGRRGFTQHQCVLPTEAGRQAVVRYMELLTERGGASFLCVIKDCGDEGDGLLSFPRPGTSIALDLPIKPGTRELVAELNRFVIEHGGRIYLAKDSFTTAEEYRAMEPRLDTFLEARAKWDPERSLRSALSQRLFGDR